MLYEAIETISTQDIDLMRPVVDKFVDCLEEAVAINMLETRLSDPNTVRSLLDQTRRLVAI